MPRHGDRKGPPHPTPPPSPLLYYEGGARCQGFDERPMQPHTLIRQGHMRRPSCIVVAREVGRGGVGPCRRHATGAMVRWALAVAMPQVPWSGGPLPSPCRRYHGPVGPCRRHAGGAMNLPGPCRRHAAGTMVRWALAVAMPQVPWSAGPLPSPCRRCHGPLGPCRRHAGGAMNLPGPFGRHAAGAMVRWALAVAMPQVPWSGGPLRNPVWGTGMPCWSTNYDIYRCSSALDVLSLSGLLRM